MGNVKRTAGKALAVFTAAALLLSCGATGFVTNFATTGIEVNAADSNVATQLKVLDENGKDLGDNPILYVDNSPAAAGIITRSIKVVASNDSGVAVDDEIRCFAAGDVDKYVKLDAPKVSNEVLEATISGCEITTGDDGKTTVKSFKPGTTELSFTTASGTVFRKVTIVVYEPATDMKVYNVVNGKKTQFDVNDENMSNADSCMTIANHQYQFSADKVPSSSTDEVEWYVYEGGKYEGKGTPAQTKKAEITPSGLFTPKTNGEVTIMAKYKPTETSLRASTMGNKKITTIDSNGKKKTETVTVQTVPKYIHVTIVKENPAKDLKITNNPGALEVNDTFQLKYNATPSYTGSGYETGATDTFHWESTNPKVITVDDKGLVKAVGKGEAKIVLYGENENIRAEAAIKVLTKATSINFKSQTISTSVDSETTVTAVMSPDSADEEIVWTSSNPSIATVESLVNGAFSNEQTAVVKGVSVGTVTITARAVNSGVEKKITCNISSKIEAADIKLSTVDGTTIINIYNGTTVSVFDQKSITINGELLSANGSTPDDSIVWTVLDNGPNNDLYAAVNSQDGKSIKLTGFARGTIRIKAASKANPSLSKIFYLEILKKATKGVILDPNTNAAPKYKSINVGGTISLTADITIDTNYPHDHDDYIDHWESSNTKVFTVDNTGFVTAVGNGSATIKFVTKSGYTLGTSLTAFTTSAVILKGVTPSADSESLPTTEIILDKNMTKTKSLSATIKNEKDGNVSGCAIEWSSSNEDVATVDSNGLIKAKKLGEVVITAKSGQHSDSCLVNVNYSLGNATIEIEPAQYSPFITEYRPKVTLSYVATYTDFLGQTTSETVYLVEGRDYELTYSNNTKVGQSGTILIKGLGHYSGTPVSRTFKIAQKTISDADITIAPIDDQELTAENKSAGVKPELSIDFGGWPLVKDIDYTVAYSNNSKISTDTTKATVTITGKGNYTGKATKGFVVYCQHKTTTEKKTKDPTCKATGIATVTCSVCGYKTERELPIGDHNFQNPKTVPPTYDENGYTLYTCSVCKTTKKDNFVPALKRAAISTCTITLDKTSFTENGKVQTPKVTVKKGTTTLKENKDYTLTYSNKNSTKAGSYTVKIVGMDGYTGTVTKSYKIVSNAKSIKLDKTSVSIGVGESIRIAATTDPSSAASSVVWASSNSSVATVSNGTVTGKKAGTATITATAGTVKATCTITVRNAPSSVSISKTNISIGVGETYSLGSTIPANTAAATRTYSSSNSAVVRMTKTNWTGEFKGIKAGTAKVTVKLYNGKTATCTVTVRNAPSKVSISSGAVTLGVGETYSLTSSIPAGTAAAKRTYRSSNYSIVKMTRTDWQGDFKAMKPGTAYVTVRIFNGKEATCKVTVKAAPTWVKLNKGNMTLKVGKTASVGAVIASNAGAAKRTYRTSNSSVVKMTKTNWTGQFKAMKPGTAYVTVRLYNGKEASIKVTVVK